MAKKGLGRGLGALIPNGSATTSKSSASISPEIEISKIKANEHQPRKRFGKDELSGLAESIKNVGIIEPIILRKVADKYQIIAGERRFRAAKIAGLKKIPAIIKETTPNSAMEMALIENIQREDLNAIEEAEAYKELMDSLKLKQQELATRVGKSRTAITNSLRLLKLPALVKEFVINGELSAGHIRALLSLKTKDEIIKLAKKAINERLSVRELEKITSPKTEKEKKDKKELQTPEVYDLEKRLEETLGTKVKIKHTENGGKIEVIYYDLDDLDRIMETVTGEI